LNELTVYELIRFADCSR